LQAGPVVGDPGDVVEMLRQWLGKNLAVIGQDPVNPVG
jgi:hypothetical protein